ncbi:uncharacterized protein C2845_PM03G05780 [Panicum miliaceum]|uniref:Uncharacterized protein n=1 Tax=Panicum miliaceum TaxID=4540 RepID=A0A3L6T7M5_PANMI|nr:uncharacterized protein C2845_PM03G05780 [Panicum miliaceum]
MSVSESRVPTGQAGLLPDCKSGKPYETSGRIRSRIIGLPSSSTSRITECQQPIQPRANPQPVHGNTSEPRRRKGRAGREFHPEIQGSEQKNERVSMAEGSKPDVPLFQLLTDLLQQVESMSNQEEVELRAKIETLGLEITKVPEQAPKHLDEVTQML